MTMTDEQIKWFATQFAQLCKDVESIKVALQLTIPAPNFWRPLEDYAGFDWTAIAATVRQSDKDGATLVEWAGRMFKRYRSSDDDSKGMDIRFRRVVSGTVDEKNLRWETLIKFGGEIKDAKPLRGDVAEVVRDAARNKATLATQAPAPQMAATATGIIEPAQPPTPVVAKPTPTVNDPMKLADAIPSALPSQPTPKREPIPDALRAEWLAAYDAAGKVGQVPAEWHIAAEDTPATLATKIGALNILASKADSPAAVAGEATPTPAQALAATETTPGASLTEAAQKIKARITYFAERNSRASTPRQDGETVRALEAVAGSKALRQRVTHALFGESEFAKLDPRKRFAIWDWLRPASSADGKSVSPTNPTAAGEVAELLKVTEAEAEPA